VNSDKMIKMDRRKFLQTSASLGSAMMLAPSLSCQGHSTNLPAESGKSRVVTIRGENIVDPQLKMDESKVAFLLDEGLRTWFQTNDLDAIWRSLVKPHDVVGIKVNCLAGHGLSTHSVLVNAIINGLKRVGVKERNIIVWDRLNNDLKRAGFKVNTRGSGVKYLGNDSAGYSQDLVCYGEVGSLVSRVATDLCTALINVPILKDHGIVGVSVALKNYFGAIHNPNKYHDNIGDPYVADVNMFPDLREKTRFTICDALVAQYEGGPPYMPHWAWPFGGLILGKDMVAIDQIGWNIIEAKRKEKGLPNLRVAGREPTYIATAATPDYQLGVNDLNKIEYVEAFI